jgi:hypothetical protein
VRNGKFGDYARVRPLIEISMQLGKAKSGFILLVSGVKFMLGNPMLDFPIFLISKQHTFPS